jgi:hypothetical protein
MTPTRRTRADVPASGIGRRLHPRLGRHLLHGAPPWDLDHAPPPEERRSDGVDVHPAEQKVFTPLSSGALTSPFDFKRPAST